MIINSTNLDLAFQGFKTIFGDALMPRLYFTQRLQ